MSSGIQNNYLQKGVSQFLTPAKISEIATRIGLNAGASFSPNEYRCLEKICTSLALEKMNCTNGFTAQSLSEKVTTIVSDLIEKQCQKDDSAQEVMPQFLQDFLATAFWKITSPFYS